MGGFVPSGDTERLGGLFGGDDEAPRDGLALALQLLAQQVGAIQEELPVDEGLLAAVFGALLDSAIAVADTGVADTDFTVAHNLGYIPDSFLLMDQDRAGSVYKSGTAWTATDAYLRASAANMSVKLRVF